MGPLTEQMVSDFGKYLKDPERFRQSIAEDVEESGDVVSVEDVLAVDGSGDVLQRVYRFADGSRRVLDSAQAGVRSL